MALLRTEGFDHWGEEDGDGTSFYTSSTYYSVVTNLLGAGRRGGRCFHFEDSRPEITMSVPNSPTTLIFGAAVKYAGDSEGDKYFFYFKGVAGTFCWVGFNIAGGQVIAGTYPNTTYTFARTATGVVPDRKWFYLEVKVVLSTGTSGEFYVRINGHEVISETGIKTQYNGSEGDPITNIFFNSPLGYGHRIDDLYICDNTGTTNNDFLGDVSITTLWPDADGTHTDFTLSSGTDHYAMADIEFRGDTASTDYAESSTTGHKETYSMGTFSETTDILGVQAVTMVNNSAGAGSVTARPLCRSGATPTDNEGADVAVGTSFDAMRKVWEKEPTDTAAWTASSLNNAEFGLKVESQS